MEGFCGTCREVVVVDGRPVDEYGTWSHLRVGYREIVVPGHADGCWGDCTDECPVPVQDWEPYQIECGPVYLGDPE